MKNKVVFASTNYGPLWRPVVDSWLRLVAFTSRQMTVEMTGSIAGIGVTDRSYTHSAQNALVKDFLSIPDATHLFLTESDMILPDDCIIKLLALDKDMASGLYFLRHGNGQPCLYKKTFVHRDNKFLHSPVSLFPTSEPFRIDCSGVGCVLIKRKVFETVEFPWFDLKEANYGSDMYFYTKTKEAGLELWVDPRVLCCQIDYTIWNLDDYHNRLKTDPEFAKNGFIIGDPTIYDGKTAILEKTA